MKNYVVNRADQIISRLKHQTKTKPYTNLASLEDLVPVLVPENISTFPSNRYLRQIHFKEAHCSDTYV